jgi:hypothetical protein
VAPGAFEVFWSLLDRSEQHGPVNWSDFTAAMTGLGFTLETRYGSVMRFAPPTTMAMQRPLTIHRPHGSKMEGRKKDHIAARLRDVYGWHRNTFEVR